MLIAVLLLFWRSSYKIIIRFMSMSKVKFQSSIESLVTFWFECSAYSPPSIVDALKSEKMLNFVDYAKNNVVLCWFGNLVMDQPDHLYLLHYFTMRLISENI